MIPDIDAIVGADKKGRRGLYDGRIARDKIHLPNMYKL